MPLRERFQKLKQDGHAIAALTAYNYPIARLLSETDLDLILVGDSLAMVELGHKDTVDISIDVMIHHLKSCAKVTHSMPLIADLPAGSYDTPEHAVRNAKQLMEYGADGVKLEGGIAIEAQLHAIAAAGIPILGHIGMLPQHVREEGGYKEKGKSDAEAAQLLADAKILDSVGAFGVVMELVTPPLARKISQEISIPTIGIGSGEACDGQILVTYDLIGLFPWFKPRFVRPKADVAGEIRRAVGEFIKETRQSGK